MTPAPCSLGQRRVSPSLQWMGTLRELELAPCHLTPLVPPSVQCMCVRLVIQQAELRPLLLSLCMVRLMGWEVVQFLYKFFSFAVVPTITSFVPEEGRYVVNVTDTVTFQCSATGFPPPTIQWFRAGQVLNSSTDSRISISDNLLIESSLIGVSATRRTLTIANVMASDTATDYSCTASNDATGGMDSESFEVLVQGMLNLLGNN